MKILSLTLNNFRQFYGKQTINFSIDDKKNITLIHAENGVGKTALLNAIRWCLFGDTTANFKDKDILLNHIAKDKGEYLFSVTLQFEEDNEKYTCIRGNTPQDKISFNVYHNTDVRDKLINEPDLFINSIIPKDMIDYFFFQGEGIGSLTQSSPGTNKKVKDAIHRVLGFTIANHALIDLNEIKKEYRKKISELDKDGEISRLSNSISKLEDEIFQLYTQLEKSKNSSAMYSSKIHDIDQKLISSNSNDIKENTKQRKILEREIDEIKLNLSTKQRAKKKLFSDFGVAIFASKLANKALDFINEEEFKGTIPAPYNENLVKQILEEHNCICGAEIHPGSAAYQNIKKLLENAADPIQGNRVVKARETLKSIRDKNKNARNYLLENIKDISNLNERLSRTLSQLEEISQKLENVEVDEIGKLEKLRRDYQNNLNSDLRLIGATENRIQINKTELTQKKNLLNQIQSTSKEVVIFQEQLAILIKVEELIQNTLTDAENSMVSDLPAMINDLLSKYVRQDYTAKVNKDTYEIRLIDRNGRKVAESDGQQLLLSLTFISCLIAFAAKRKNADGEILTPGAIAPFVIDAPFGVLDNKYKGNMAKSIPESVEQVIFLLSSSHWEGSVEENIRERIGAEYNLVAEVQSEQGSKEESHILIKNKKFDNVRYNCEVDCTKIEEVIL